MIDYEEIDPFGEDLDPGAKPIGRGKKAGMSVEDFLGKTPAKFKVSDHNKRSREHYEKLGYMVVRVDQTKHTQGGAVFTVDFLGLFDWMAFKAGSPILGIQVCATSNMDPHVTVMCSEQITSFNKAKKCDNLLAWLECGCAVDVLGWKKEGSRWIPTVRPLTMDDLVSRMERRAKRQRKAV